MPDGNSLSLHLTFKLNRRHQILSRAWPGQCSQQPWLPPSEDAPPAPPRDSEAAFLETCGPVASLLSLLYPSSWLCAEPCPTQNKYAKIVNKTFNHSHLPQPQASLSPLLSLARRGA